MAFYKRYVDDENIKANAVSPGYNWDSRSSSLVLGCNPEDDTRSPDERTAMVFKDVANSVTSMLTQMVSFRFLIYLCGVKNLREELLQSTIST